VDVDTEGRLVCDWDNGRRYRYWQWRDWPTKQLYLAPGDPIIACETMVAGLVAPPGGFACTETWDLRAALSDPDPGERYAAVRVAGVTQRHDLADRLEYIARNEPAWRLRLEATASLARLDPNRTEPIVKMAATPADDDEPRMEAVFVLSEIPTDEAAEALAEIAAQDGEKPQELRAAAVWGLARGVQPRPDLVLPYTVDDVETVALHAISGLPSLPDELIPDLLVWLRQDDIHAAAAAQLLMRHEKVGPLLTAVLEGGRVRLWALRALGDLSPNLVRSLGGELLTPEIECALEPIWIGREDWLRGTGAEELAALDAQRVRYSPLTTP
jgi:HEAT repeat protein